MERRSVTSEAREEGGAVRNVQVEEKQDERKGDRGKLESGSRGKEEWEHDESRSVVPPRNHRRRRPLVWKNDSSVLTECPCFCLPLQSPLKPLRGWLRVDCGGWLPPRGWRNAGVGGVREGDEMPAPDSLIAAAQLCVPLWRSVKLSLSVAQPRTTPLLLASSPSISLLSLARLRSSFPRLLSPAGVADLGVMTYRVSSARRSQTPFLWPPLCLPRSFHLSSVNFFPGLFGWPGRAAVSRCLG